MPRRFQSHCHRCHKVLAQTTIRSTMAGDKDVTDAVKVDAKRPRKISEKEKEEEATSSETTEQPRKKARREDQAKCSKCKKRLARRGTLSLY